MCVCKSNQFNNPNAKCGLPIINVVCSSSNKRVDIKTKLKSNENIIKYKLLILFYIYTFDMIKVS